MASKGVSRRWHLDHNGIRREGSKESGFTFRTPDGSAVKQEKVLARIKKLRIPPAWQDVRIAPGDSAPLQVLGVDKKGRTQYLYHSRFRQQREDEKFLRVVRFGEALPKLRRQVRTDLKRGELEKDTVVAAMVRLIDQGFFRIGNDESARSELTYGLTTIRPKHVKVVGDRLSFDYVGKWKKKQGRSLRDADVARLIDRLKREKGGELFKFRTGKRFVDVKDRHVNEYIQRFISDDFTAKDFRTWAGTLLCFTALAKQGPPLSQTDGKRKVRKAIVETAQQLGNTPAVCKSSYICPMLIDEYMVSRPFESLRGTRKGNPVALIGLSIEEKALRKLFRQTIADRRKEPRAA